MAPLLQVRVSEEQLPPYGTVAARYAVHVCASATVPHGELHGAGAPSEQAGFA